MPSADAMAGRAAVQKKPTTTSNYSSYAAQAKAYQQAQAQKQYGSMVAQGNANQAAQRAAAQKAAAQTASRASQRPATDWNTYEKVWTQEAGWKLPQLTQPTGNLPQMPGSGGSGGGGYGGYGGGGGGGGVNPADYNKYAAAMKALLASSLYNAPQALQAPAAIAAPAAQQNLLSPMIDPAVDADIASARGAYANIGNQVSMVDPYLQLLATQAPQVDAGLSKFANAQGVGGDYQAQLALANQGQAAAADNWSKLAGILGQNFLTGQQNTVDTARLQGENIVSGLEGQRTNLRAAANQQQMQLDQRAQDQALQLQREQRDIEMQIAQMNQQRAFEAQQQKAAAIMQLIAAGLPYGQAPDLAGLI